MSDTVVSDRFSERASDELRREIMTPEGVPLVFTIGRAGDRMAGFLLDVLCIGIVLFLIGVLGLMAGGAWTGAAALLAFFLLRNGYFTWFELRTQGRTPGKRRVGLRVMDARGRMLRPEAVLVRNLTREVEVFLPIVLLSDPRLLGTSGPGWVQALAVLWVAVFLVMPLLNSERRRVGDLLAGTMVVYEHRALLRHDLGSSRRERQPAAVQFTKEQLEMYGVYELQVLEELLRDEPRRSKAFEVVARKVKRKIGWRGDDGGMGARDFLRAFYLAQRERLEKDLLLGKARERKRGGRLR